MVTLSDGIKLLDGAVCAFFESLLRLLAKALQE